MCVGPLSYRLELPDSMRVHNVFHVCYLKPYRDEAVSSHHLSLSSLMMSLSLKLLSYWIIAILSMAVSVSLTIFYVSLAMVLKYDQWLNAM